MIMNACGMLLLHQSTLLFANRPTIRRRNGRMQFMDSGAIDHNAVTLVNREMT